MEQTVACDAESAIAKAQRLRLKRILGGLRDTLRQKNAALTDTMAELEVLATRDPLTRLPNRRTAMAQLDRELSRTDRRGAARRTGPGARIITPERRQRGTGAATRSQHDGHPNYGHSRGRYRP
ncbi:MAG: hypothetical protein U5Q16_05370 [Gammaproteobacteria bacterium]|nr:hypothetical protein [Gammaproteobacteria bacterium]